MAQENTPTENEQNAKSLMEGKEAQNSSNLHVFGDISSRLIRQWILEGKAEYEQQQRQPQDNQDESLPEEPKQ